MIEVSYYGISIHAPHVGSDLRQIDPRTRQDISIHAPHVGSDSSSASPMICAVVFQSTLPMWGAMQFRTVKSCRLCISIHAPMWGATKSYAIYYTMGQFQSALPVWGATVPPPVRRQDCDISIHAPLVGSDTSAAGECNPLWISIHAPHVGSDTWSFWHLPHPRDFNPRPPCGERLLAAVFLCRNIHFNPRPPCGERRRSFRK